MNSDAIQDIATMGFFAVLVLSITGFLAWDRWLDHKERMSGVNEEDDDA